MLVCSRRRQRYRAVGGEVDVAGLRRTTKVHKRAHRNSALIRRCDRDLTTHGRWRTRRPNIALLIRYQWVRREASNRCVPKWIAAKVVIAQPQRRVGHYGIVRVWRLRSPFLARRTVDGRIDSAPVVTAIRNDVIFRRRTSQLRQHRLNSRNKKQYSYQWPHAPC